MNDESPQKSTRKKFLIWSATILSSVGIMKSFPGSKQKKIPPAEPTVKMLTEDGRLVEIDLKLLASAGKKVTNEELQKWIKK